MNKNFLKSLTLFSLIFYAPQAYSETYELDSAHSDIGFSVRHLGINNVKGAFRKYTGTIVYDPAKPEATTVEVEIDSGSIDTANAKRDDHVKSKDFLNSSIFPKLKFKSTKVSVKEDKSLVVAGDLTILNFTKPVELTVTDITGPVLNPLDKKNHVGATVTGQLKRQDFGVTWNGGGITGVAGEAAIGDIIKLNFEIDGMQTK